MTIATTTTTTIKFKPGKLYRIRGGGRGRTNRITLKEKFGKGFQKCSPGEILMFVGFDTEKDMKGKILIWDLDFLNKDGKILTFVAFDNNDYREIKWRLMPINNNNQKEKGNVNVISSVHTKV